MFIVFALVGFIGVPVSLVLLLIAAVRKRPKKKLAIVAGLCFASFVVALIISPPAKDNDATSLDTKSPAESAVTQTDKPTISDTAQISEKPEAVEPPKPAEPSPEEKKAQKLLDDAKKKFEESNYKKMIELCNELIEKYPDTDVAKTVPSFIAGLNEIIIKVSAEDIYNAYEENEIKADSTYEDKLVSVSGSVSSIGKDVFDDVFVTLSNGESYSLMNPHFTFKDESEIAKVAELKEGDHLVIIGTCTGASVGSPMFKDCYIIG